jgi:hypothetical protein
MAELNDCLGIMMDYRKRNTHPALPNQDYSVQHQICRIWEVIRVLYGENAVYITLAPNLNRKFTVNFLGEK